MEKGIVDYFDAVFSICNEIGDEEDHPEVSWYAGWLSMRFFTVKEDYQLHVDCSLVTPENNCIWIKTCCTSLQSEYDKALEISKEYMRPGGGGSFSVREFENGISIIGIKEVKVRGENYSGLYEQMALMIDRTLALAKKIGRQELYPVEEWLDDDFVFEDGDESV